MAAKAQTRSPHSVSEPVALQIEAVNFAYPNFPPVLQDLNLEVGVGERVALIGPNGAGKTTLFLSVCGVLKPSSGTIRVFGSPVKPGEFRPEVGLVFQNASDQLFSPSVWDDVAFGLENMGYSNEDIERRVCETLKLTGVSELSDRAPHHLSGGQKRMVAIASVLAMKPKLVVYDEPTANLDLRARRRLIQFLQRSQETLIIAAHDLDMLLEVCDRAILLDGGCIVADGDPRDLMGDRDLMEAHGLEKPHLLHHPHLNRNANVSDVNSNPSDTSTSEDSAASA